MMQRKEEEGKDRQHASKDLVTKDEACFLGGCVRPCELGSPPRAPLLTSGHNLSHL